MNMNVEVTVASSPIFEQIVLLTLVVTEASSGTVVEAGAVLEIEMEVHGRGRVRVAFLVLLWVGELVHTDTMGLRVTRTAATVHRGLLLAGPGGQGE